MRKMGYSEGLSMPTISMFFGILIRMFFNEHSPPHFHAEYAEYKWAELHQAELLEDWELCRSHVEPHPIEPLQ